MDANEALESVAEQSPNFRRSVAYIFNKWSLDGKTIAPEVSDRAIAEFETIIHAYGFRRMQ